MTIDEFAARLNPPYDRSMKLGGEFVFLGTADEGSPEFDAHPPNGVAKVYHNTKDRAGKDWTKGRAGFFICSRLRFGAFKRANASWNGVASWGYYDCTGDYPIARTVIIPWADGSNKMPNAENLGTLVAQGEAARVKNKWRQWLPW